jgi:hypothetical protein
MERFGQYIDEAIPHEAGHILVGRAVGLHARGLDVEVVRLPNGTGISVGNFATLFYSPPDEEIPKMDPMLKAAYMLYVSGGVAGNKFTGLKTACQGADADRKELARLTNKSLEEIAEMAVGIIQKRRRAFRQLVSLIRQRFTERVWNNRTIQTGRLNLLAQEDLDKLFSEYPSAGKEQENPQTE